MPFGRACSFFVVSPLEAAPGAESAQVAICMCDRHVTHLGAAGSRELDYAHLGHHAPEGEGPQPSPIVIAKRAQSEAVAADVVPIKGEARPWPARQ